MACSGDFNARQEIIKLMEDNGMDKYLKAPVTITEAPTGVLWIMDEPFNALDVKAVGMIQLVLSEHLDSGGLVILPTHRLLYGLTSPKWNDIVAGLCRSLARNYLATVARGKPILPPVVFRAGWRPIKVL